MRWKLLRRRLSVSAPRMIVRSHLPWPLRWAVLALMLGFSAALTLWAFEFGKSIAGLDQHAKLELERLRVEVEALRGDLVTARKIADSADSLVKAERSAQERLAQQVRQLESRNHELQSDLGFFEGLMPVSGEGVQLRGLQVEMGGPGLLRYQLLVMQSGRNTPEFKGRYELVLNGTLGDKTWTQSSPGTRELTFRQYARVDGAVELPADVVLQTVQARVFDHRGALKAVQTGRL